MKKVPKMKQERVRVEDKQLLQMLLNLPRNMIRLHTSECLPTAVLYALCHKSCFNLGKAAYFIDNPDFDCCKGIAGIDISEIDLDIESLWAEDQKLKNAMDTSQFHGQVKAVDHPSYSKSQEQMSEKIERLAGELGIKNPDCFVWEMKHNNHGLLICESVSHLKEKKKYLEDGLHLLSFCPIH